jgi:excisionase family DNA binding protein
MEKICLARRRRRDLSPAERATGGPSETMLTDTATLPVRCAPPGSPKTISMELTEEQSGIIQSGAGLTPGRACMVALETREAESGQVIFTFRMAPLFGGKMLSPSDVSAMLRISRSSLARLTKTHKLDSYRIGRLRRFLLEDVLHYLSRIREFPEAGI